MNFFKKSYIFKSITSSFFLINLFITKQDNKKSRMFSLSDEITKFEKQTFVLTDDRMTIDERFLEGGITMNDLIQENSFIIAEMRKVKSVFLNYCKLNDKVYKTIMEHEINSADLLNRINNIGSTIDRKLEVSSNEMKRLKEKTLQDNQKTKDVFENINRQIMEKMGEKLDEKFFTSRVQQMIQEYDSVPENTSEQHNTDFEEGKPQIIGGELQSPLKGNKRKRGITVQDLQMIKNEIMPQIQSLKEKVEYQGKSMSEHDAELKSLFKLNKKSTQQIQWTRQDLQKTSVQLKESRTKQKEGDERLQSLLNEKINEDIWEKKFNNFNEKCVKYEIVNLHNMFYPKIKNLDQESKKVKIKFLEIDKQFAKCYNKIEELKKENEGVRGELNGIKLFHRQQMKRKQQELEEAVQIINSKIKSENIKQEEKIKQLRDKLGQVQETQNKLSQTVADLVLKKVEIKIGWQMKEMKKQINQISQKSRKNKIIIDKHQNQIIHIEDIVSKKANFTDLLHHVDGKADKKDFKQIQDILTSPKTQREEQCLETGGDSQRLSSSRRKTLSYSKRPKSSKHENPKKNLLDFAHYTESKQIHRPKYRQSSRMKNEKFRSMTSNTLFVI